MFELEYNGLLVRYDGSQLSEVQAGASLVDARGGYKQWLDATLGAVGYVGRSQLLCLDRGSGGFEDCSGSSVVGVTDERVDVVVEEAKSSVHVVEPKVELRVVEKVAGGERRECEKKFSDVGGSTAVSRVCDVVSVVPVHRGKWYEKNKRSRERRKQNSRVCVKPALQVSLEAKWESENKLAKAKADRQLELLQARDLEAEKKMQRAQIMRTTESAKVQTERAYATLKRTGNVPGFAETVVTDGSCPALSPSRSDGTCISPDSSVSQQEIRAMMKELEDCKLTLKRIERDNPALVAHHMEGHGVKTAFTLDSDGLCPVDEPGSMGADGKYHLDSYEPNPRFYKDRFRAEEFAERYFGS